ncbi:odorant receptor 13a-like [Frieseomelitta varia]|uniref:odorant receptor 13a-like n=1 Tax=Frieseomelitta varia TaxID=561572 RepID=UPI001CB67B18|nr:odorant receptor 13a-like [Frieseomelitta varia]
MNIRNYVFINQLVLKFVGLYPINIIRYVICISCVMLIIIPQIINIYIHWNDLNIVMETGSTLLTISLATLKSVIWMFNRKNLEIFIEFMLTDYWRIIEDNVFEYLKEYAIYAKTITKGYFISMCNALLFFFSLPIIEILIIKHEDSDNLTMKNFPFVALYPIAFYKFPFYQIVYVSQILATSICCLVILATDGLIATALLHTCGHFAVLRKNLKQLDSYIDRIIDLKPNSKHISANLYEIKSQMIHIIKHHQVVLWFCDNMEKNFHLMLFLQAMTSSLLICFVGFQVSATLMEQSKMIKFASHLIVALFQLLLFCFPGDMLMQQSLSISTAAYAIQWFQLPSFVKDEICMIILRSQRPSYITAGKLYIMHLENFTTILSTAFSYFMMLQSFNSES